MSSFAPFTQVESVPVDTTAMAVPVPEPSTTPANEETRQRQRSTRHRRSRSGCFTCRVRRKKCDEGHPSCGACTSLCLKCDYHKPSWWVSAEQRRIQKERIKDRIRHTKVMEKEGSMRDYMNQFREVFSERSPIDTNISTSFPATSVSPVTPGVSPTASHGMGFTFPPAGQTFFPSNNNGFQYGFEQSQIYGYAPGYMDESNLPLSSFQGSIPVMNHDRPLLTHFLDHVLQLIYPVLEAHQRRPARTSEIIRSLETNKSYLHCCLSVSAVHIKTTMGVHTEQINRDILRHRYEAVSQLCQLLKRGADHHEEILDATLAMIFFHCSVGGADDTYSGDNKDHLPDIPWNAHFQAVSNLINKLNFVPPPLGSSLIAWIDIFGATMLGKSPQFAHTYRNRHVSGTSTGLQELMGCDDHVMYLISEISCLESLKASGRVTDEKLRHHISALSMQLEHTSSADATLEWPCTASPGGSSANSYSSGSCSARSSSTASVNPQKLTRSTSALFCIAARIYLRSLAPGFSCNQPNIISLVGAAAEILRYIPAGRNGFDRALVWPLLITGAYSIPSSPFRAILAERASLLGDLGDFGSFGRMYRLLQELWRLSDDMIMPPLPSSATETTFPERPLSPSLGTPGRPLRKQQVHWRDVMKRHGWDYLLI